MWRKLVMVFGATLLLQGCTDHQETQQIEKAVKKEVALEQKETPKSPEPTVSTATLSAIGDMLIHDTVYQDAKTGNTYDFKPMIQEVKPYLEETDITIANQESMIGGTEIGLSSYPSFNSPYEVGDALKDAGVDLVTLANNHTLDRGEKAIQSAIKHWNELGIPYTGSFVSQEDKAKIRTITKNEIDFSFLAYTYGTNGIPVPEGKDHLVNLINLPLIKEEVVKAKEVSDITVVSLHFGAEYQRLPNEEQKQIVKELANAGVDIIIGHHPHVLQPTEWVEGQNGHKTFVIYSLGNFLSGQMRDYKDIGGIVQIKVEKTELDGVETISLKEPSFIPTHSGRNEQGHFRVVPLSEYSNEQYKETISHMKKWMPELQIKQ